ncbi:MAG: SDR family NAD(P)-dependent oxidoreductase [Planctomycetaceae bacterium]|nr:SDR family NAD(P)-dependent oxidoreductase [Planctomycetaceae bacterium]
MNNYWRNKVVLVTGGSSGLGRVIAEAFGRAGARLAIAALEEADVHRAAGEMQESGIETVAICANITRQQDVERMMAETVSHFGQLDVLVNNAGRSMRGGLLDTTPEQFQSLFDLNVLGTIRCTQAAVPHLLKTRGHIVNIGSLAAKSASRWIGAYPVSKFAVAAFSQQLRLELGPEGVHTLLVCPGPIKRDSERLYPLEGTTGIPENALTPGAGVKVGEIDPQRLAAKILNACERRKPELVLPARARLLFAIAQLFPSFGDWLVLKNT